MFAKKRVSLNRNCHSVVILPCLNRVVYLFVKANSYNVPKRSPAFAETLTRLDIQDELYLKGIQHRLRQRRIELGWTQAYAAERLGVGLNWYQQLESKQVWRFNPTLLRLLTVARVMGISPAQLLADTTDDE